MNTDRIFISSSETKEGKFGVDRVVEGLIKINRKFDFIESKLKSRSPSIEDKKMIMKRLENTGVTIFVLSSDFLTTNKNLLKENELNKGQVGWNYEELRASLVWNSEKFYNSVIIVYTDEFCKDYLQLNEIFDFPIINQNINNIIDIRSAEVDSKDYFEIISLNEFLNKPKLYLNKVDSRKRKHFNNNLYNFKNL